MPIEGATKQSRIIVSFETSNVDLKKAIETGGKMVGIEMELESPPEKLDIGEGEWAINITRTKVEELKKAIKGANQFIHGVRIEILEIIRPSHLPDVDLEF